MKTIKLIGAVLSLASFLSLTSTAHAAGGNGVVTGISIANGANFGTVSFTGVSGGRPACHNAGSGYAAQFSFDISTAKGKGLLSLLEGAQLAGKSVGFGGNGICFTVESGVSIEQLSIAGVFTN